MRKLLLVIACLFFISTSNSQKQNISKPVRPTIINDVSELANCMAELDAKIK